MSCELQQPQNVVGTTRRKIYITSKLIQFTNSALKLLKLLLNQMERLNRRKHCHLELRAGIVGQHLAGSSNGNIARSLDVSVIFHNKKYGEGTVTRVIID